MAPFRMRPGLRNSDPNPQSSRALSFRLGARRRARRSTMSCCLSTRFSAITARTPPGPHSFAVMTVRWSRASRKSFMRETAQATRRRPRNVAQSGNQRENWQFETHRLEPLQVSAFAAEEFDQRVLDCERPPIGAGCDSFNGGVLPLIDRIDLAAGPRVVLIDREEERDESILAPRFRRHLQMARAAEEFVLPNARGKSVQIWKHGSTVDVHARA